MKYISALLLAFLLLIPMGLIANLPHNVNAHVGPALFVTPEESTFQGPCLTGTTFNVSVNIFNAAFSGIDIYGFSFTLDWSAIANYVTLDSVAVSSPWASGDYFLVNNATSPPGATDGYITDYSLAITATPPGTGLVNVQQAVVTLTFTLNGDICWPNNVLQECGFNLLNVQLVGDGSITIPITLYTVECGSFEMYSVQPNIELVDADAILNSTTPSTPYPVPTYGSVGPLGTEMLVEKCISHETDVEVELTNVTSVYGFTFTLMFDPTHLEVDPQKVTIKAAFPPPYEYLNIVYTPTSEEYTGLSPITGLPTFIPVPGSDSITVTVIRPCEKPTVCGSTIPAVDIVFHSIDLVYQDIGPDAINPPGSTLGYGPGQYAPELFLSEDVQYWGGLIPTQSQSWIEMCSAAVFTKCDVDTLGSSIPLGTTEYSFNSPAVPPGYSFTFVYDSASAPYGPWTGTNGINPGSHVYNGGLIYGVYSNTNPWGYGSVVFPLITTFGNDGVPFSKGTEVYNSIMYWFHPSKYDLNLDCTVDIQDLIVLAYVYGVTLADPYWYGYIFNDGTGTVSIYDFVSVAKHFGPVDP